MLYKKLLGDGEVLNLYNYISKRNTCPFDHSITHIYRTCENAKTLADMLEINDRRKELLLSSCALHDIGYAHSRYKHAIFGALKCKNILKRYNFHPEDIEMISSAISSHNSLNLADYIFDISILTMLADKLDISHFRVNTGFIHDNSPLLNIEYVSFERAQNSISVLLNCKPETIIKEVEVHNLVAKLDDYLELASMFFSVKFCLKINKRKALTN